MELKAKDRSTIERALGIIEGVACGVSERAADMLYTAVEMIDSVVLAVAKMQMTTATVSETERVQEEG